MDALNEFRPKSVWPITEFPIFDPNPFDRISPFWTITYPHFDLLHNTNLYIVMTYYCRFAFLWSFWGTRHRGNKSSLYVVLQFRLNMLVPWLANWVMPLKYTPCIAWPKRTLLWISSYYETDYEILETDQKQHLILSLTKFIAMELQRFTYFVLTFDLHQVVIEQNFM